MTLGTFSETSLCLGLYVFSLRVGQTAIRLYLVAPCCPLLRVDLREGRVLQCLSTSHGNLDMPLIPGNTVIDIKMLALTASTQEWFSRMLSPQSIQSSRLSIQSSELGSPLTRKWVLIPLPLGPGGRHTLLRGRGWGDPIPTNEHTLVLYVPSVYYNPPTAQPKGIG